MKRPRTLPAFSTKEREAVQVLLATHVITMMGRKMEEGDWSAVYCKAKGIPDRGWSNLNIDINHDLLGVEQKMYCYRSSESIEAACGRTIMHPSATRSIRIPSLDTEPNEAMKIILTQYGELIDSRRQKVAEEATSTGEVDLRTGWLLWQESLRQFLYFEEEMLKPDPSNYTAVWHKNTSASSRRESTSLWIYEKESGIKRYSVTTEAGAKIQPYFDVPPLTDPNVYIFTVIGEQVNGGLVRVWVTPDLAEKIKQRLNTLDSTAVSELILRSAPTITAEQLADATLQELAVPILITEQAYESLSHAIDAPNDEQRFSLLLKFLSDN